MAGSVAFVWGDASLHPLGCLATKAGPQVLPFSNPAISWGDLQYFSGVQEAAPGAEPFLGSRVLME